MFITEFVYLTKGYGIFISGTFYRTVSSKYCGVLHKMKKVFITL